MPGGVHTIRIHGMRTALAPREIRSPFRDSLPWMVELRLGRHSASRGHLELQVKPMHLKASVGHQLVPPTADDSPSDSADLDFLRRLREAGL